MLVKGDATVNKLILLFVFDKMETALSENTIVDMCCSTNDWISYMDYKPILHMLLEHSFITNISTGDEALYCITPDGRNCLADFYTQIPISLREEIATFTKNNRSRYRKKQECVSDYFKNRDGTYTVYLKILDPSQPLLELKFTVPDRQTAKSIYKKWVEKASGVYQLIYDNLVD